MDNLSFLVKDTTKSVHGKDFVFWGLSTSFSTVLFSGVICSENASNNQTVSFILQSITNCYAKILKNVFSMLYCAANCFDCLEPNSEFLLSEDQNYRIRIRV